jgi:two-component system sensor histidine kinase/response regulator
MVASEILGRLGIEIDIANNGREALEMVRRSRDKYDAVLMDVQMPEMDGLAATRAIRSDPAVHDLPILAMTANAMKADVDACRAAGMNDHITKPIERKTLLQTLRRWLPAREKVEVSDSSPRPATVRVNDARHLEGIDVAGSLERLGLEFGTFERMLIRFADGQRAMLDALRTAVTSGDSAAVARHAHTLAGASGNLGADALRNAAKVLEHAGREDRHDLEPFMADVEANAAVVFRSIDTLRDGRAADSVEPAEAFVPIAARGSLERLQLALSDFDFSSASTALADLEAIARPAAVPDLARLREHVDTYEFDEARVLAVRMLAQIGSAVR